MSLPDWLAFRARVLASREALCVGERAWSWAQLDGETTRLAGRLAALGVQPGDRVASLLHNGLYAALLPHATMRLGATLVPLNVRLSPAETEWQLAHASPCVVIAEGRTAPLVGTKRAVVASVDPEGAAALDCPLLDGVAEREVAPSLDHDANDVLAVLYTSGTTGRPRGARLTFGNFRWSAIGSARNLGVHADDRWLACLPLFHVGGLSILVRSAIYGTTAVVHERFDAGVVNRAIDGDGITMVSVVSVMLERMLDERGDAPYPPTLRCVLVGGGAVPRPLLERCARASVPVLQTYGLTECASQVATLSPADALTKPGSAGRALYPNEIRIAREASDDAGEILVRGPIVMSGYLNDEPATSRAIVDGWLHTGDVGRLDADDYLYVLDRRDDMIVTGGENVSPAEVESVLLEHALVEEAAVIGQPDDTWGQRVVAVVRLRNGARPSSDEVAELLRMHCRERLAGYKTPTEVRVVSEPLPRTASGKIRRMELRSR